MISTYIKKRIIPLFLMMILILLMFSGCSNNGAKVLTDGFWLAEKMNNASDDLDMDFGMDYGFVFDEEGNALTIAHYLWNYVITEENEIKIYRLTGGENTSILMFSGLYNNDSDTLNLEFTEEAKDYYEIFDDYVPTLVLSHYADTEENKLIKNLLFEVWSTVDPSLLPSIRVTVLNEVQGFSNKGEYQDFRKTLSNVNEDAEIFNFKFNLDEYDNCNMMVHKYHSNEDEWRYSNFTYTIVDSANEIIVESENVNKRFILSYNEDISKMNVLDDDEGKTIYKVTNFISGV